LNKNKHRILLRLEKLHPKPALYKDFEDFIDKKALINNLIDLRTLGLATFKENTSRMRSNYGEVLEISLIQITSNGRYFCKNNQKNQVPEKIEQNDRIILNRIKRKVKDLFSSSKTPAGGSLGRLIFQFKMSLNPKEHRLFEDACYELVEENFMSKEFVLTQLGEDEIYN
jgi:hypothetical protein